MKNIQKIGIVLSFMALTSVACSSTETKEISSDSSSVVENTMAETEEAGTEFSSIVEDTMAETEEAGTELSSVVEDTMAETEELGAELSSLAEDTMAKTEEIGTDLASAVEDTMAETEAIATNISSILENPVMGTNVTLRGKIIEQMEDCFVFSDGKNKIMIHFEDEQLSYDPNTTIEISGTVESGTNYQENIVEAEHNHDSMMDTMIMVNEMEIIASNK